MSDVERFQALLSASVFAGDYKPVSQYSVSYIHEGDDDMNGFLGANSKGDGPIVDYESIGGTVYIAVEEPTIDFEFTILDWVCWWVNCSCLNYNREEAMGGTDPGPHHCPIHRMPLHGPATCVKVRKLCSLNMLFLGSVIRPDGYALLDQVRNFSFNVRVAYLTSKCFVLIPDMKRALLFDSRPRGQLPRSKAESLMLLKMAGCRCLECPCTDKRSEFCPLRNTLTVGQYRKFVAASALCLLNYNREDSMGGTDPGPFQFLISSCFALLGSFNMACYVYNNFENYVHVARQFGVVSQNTVVVKPVIPLLSMKPVFTAPTPLQQLRRMYAHPIFSTRLMINQPNKFTFPLTGFFQTKTYQSWLMCNRFLPSARVQLLNPPRPVWRRCYDRCKAMGGCDPGPICFSCRKDVVDLPQHLKVCKLKKKKLNQNHGKPGKQRDSKAAMSREYQQIEKEVKKEMKPISVIVCRQFVDFGRCDQCDELPIRVQLETIKHILAKCGRQLPCPEGQRDFVDRCCAGLAADEQFRELGQRLGEYFRCVFIPDVRLEVCEPHLLHPEKTHNVAAPVPVSLKDQIDARINRGLLDSTPETIVYNGYGVVQGCVTNLNVSAPRYVIPFRDYDVVTFRCLDDILPHLFKKTHPMIEEWIRGFWDWIEPRLKARSLLHGPSEWWRRFVPSWCSYSDSASFNPVTFRVPRTMEVDVTRSDPRDVVASYMTPILRPRALDTNVWHVAAGILGGISVGFPIVYPVSLFCYIKGCQEQGDPFDFMGETEIGLLAPRDISPLALRRDMPESNRLNQHSSNLVASSVTELQVFYQGLSQFQGFFCPELVFAHARANVLNSDVSLHRSMWSNLHAKNSTYSYPPEWHSYLLNSVPVMQYLNGASDHEYVPFFYFAPMFEDIFMMTIPFFLGLVVRSFIGYDRSTAMGRSDPGPRKNMRYYYGYRRLVNKLPRAVVRHARLKSKGRRGRLPSWFDVSYQPMMVSECFRVKNAADWMPDIRWPLGCVNGFTGRVLSQSPEPTIKWRKFYRFVKSKQSKLFGRLPYNEVNSIPEWIERTRYTASQKVELTRLFMEHFPDVSNDSSCPDTMRLRELLRILAFIKLEFYPTMKMFRAILGRNDLAKLMLGCLVKSIEDVVYQCKHFVKHVPWHERPNFVEDLFCAYSRCVNGDMTSFEASIKSRLAYVEYIVYKYVTNKWVATLIYASLYKINLIIFAWFCCIMEACRASGDVTTAIGNALVCMFVWLYVLEVLCRILTYALLCEGDDNLCSFESDIVPTADMFKQFGLICKIEYPEHYSKASFCGMIFPPNTGLILTDPLKVMLRFGWIEAKWSNASLQTILSLYRGKALCNIYQYGGCPVIDALSYAVLRVTRKYTKRIRVQEKHHLNLDFVPADENRLPPRKEVLAESRLYIEELFGLDCETQVQYEKFFDSQDDLFNIPDLLCFSDDNYRAVQFITKGPPPLFDVPPHSFEDYIRFVNFLSEHNLFCEHFTNMVARTEEGDLIQFY